MRNGPARPAKLLTYMQPGSNPVLERELTYWIYC
jgi:hypothetical protein